MRIFFIGICGAAMGNVACCLRRLGHEVAGSDAGVYPPMSTVLGSSEIDVFEGFSSEEMLGWQPDLVVVGNAASRDNEQLEYLLSHRGIEFVSLPQVIARFLLGKRPRLVIAGTHGKTTTTAAAAFAFKSLGIEAGYLVGGVLYDLETGTDYGDEAQPFVIEGDEYDSAIFDKRSKFQHYFSEVFVIGNLEFDHGDIFHDLADYLRSFRHAVRLIPREGTLLINGDDASCRELADSAFCTVLTVGVGDGNDFQIQDFEDSPRGSCFIVSDGKERLSCNLSLNGLFNARNAVMAAVGVDRVAAGGVSWTQALSTLSQFRGVKRRMELRFDEDEVRVFEDFGHHPSAVEASLASLRERFPDSQIWAAFEPRSNTTVTRRFQAEFEAAFSLADRLDVAPIFRAERIPPENRLDADALAGAVQHGCAWSDWERFQNELPEAFAGAPGKRLIVFFSNGSFQGLIERMTKALSF
ncbi:MAG: Mur ligase domain-containing protein [Opitutales bacterium]|nr:Mur ligase domain-containing protein [Opitutales bacterium]